MALILALGLLNSHRVPYLLKATGFDWTGRVAGIAVRGVYTIKTPSGGSEFEMRTLSHPSLLVIQTLSVVLGALCLVLVGQSSAAAATTAAHGLVEEEVTVPGAGVELGGTILLPAGQEEAVPGIVLIHGAGSHTRDSLRQEAEAFTELGVATLIYDKRQEGYSQFERSYELLANDAVAAVATLAAHPRVDAEAVGIWGLSEGAGVAPLAARKAADVEFVVTIAASGVSPLQQTSWAIDNTFAERGVTGSLREMVTTTGMRVLRGMDVFAEADFDPVPSLQQLDVPVLAMWGADDQTAPPTESAHIFAQAIDHPDGPHLSLRPFPHVGHELKTDTSAPPVELASDYPETVITWVNAVVNNDLPREVRDDFPPQVRTSTPLAPLAWRESEWAQLLAVVVLSVGFLAYPIAAGFGLLRRHRSQSQTSGDSAGPEGTVLTASPQISHRLAIALAAFGLVAIVGFFLYYGTVMFSDATMLGPVIGTRPIIWLLLQALAVVTVVLVIVLMFRTFRDRLREERSIPVSLVLMLIAGMVFIPWALYWGLLIP